MTNKVKDIFIDERERVIKFLEFFTYPAYKFYPESKENKEVLVRGISLCTEKTAEVWVIEDPIRSIYCIYRELSAFPYIFVLIHRNN
jgi:hypothetical protein